MRHHLPSAARNPTSLVGVAVATATGVLFLGLLVLETLGLLRNPYVGLLLFVAIPALFLVGLMLIPVGIWRRRRRLALGGTTEDWPVIDFRMARTRLVVVTLAVLTLVNGLIVSLAAYGAVHHMESASFCGTTCHTTMEPEYAAYQVSPHARVACVACHVGPGAGALIESKVAGTRQLWQLLSNNVPTPVAAPVQSMRPARDTCETCHWAETSRGDTLRQIRDYADDKPSTETVTTLRLHVGGGRSALNTGSGIHWHMNVDNRVEYITTDGQRQTIPWMKVTDRHGRAKEYTTPGTTPAQLAHGEHRVMDCMDCHNRPAHTFAPSAERAIDGAIALGQIPRDLPFVRREAVAAVKASYASNDAALSGIDARLRQVYRAEASSPSDTLALTVAGVQDVYRHNVFPAMKVGWGTYPNHLGHVDTPGCFRCHDDSHKTPEGAALGQDCESCHEVS